MRYLNLVRYQNLLFIALAQILIKYGLFHPFEIDITLNAFGFSMLVFATLCIAAAGYVINDIYDVAIDRINKPERQLIGTKIPEKTAYRLFFALNVLGVAIGFYLSSIIGRPGFAALFVIISASLFLYASYLKGIVLIGNILISVLVGLSLLIVGLFDLLPAITPENRGTQSLIFGIILDYAIFAFFLNLIREIVKDLEDINGDKNGGLNTLPILIGRNRTLKIVFALGAVAVLAVVFYMYEYFYYNQILVLYFLFAVVAPLLYFCVKAWPAETKKDFSRLSSILKTTMFTGICSLALYQFVIL